MIARIVLPLLLVALAATVATPARGAPRDTVDRVATLIENNFYDAERGRTIAEELRATARSGRFDALTDPRDLAANLTSRLRTIDHHFNVTWSRKPTAATAVPLMSSETLDRRNAYGFSRVEMLPGAIGYIDMRSFADFAFGRTDPPARKAAEAALALVASADAIIIDLRRNGGGSPAMVGYLVSAFTPSDADIYNVFHRRDGTESERPKDPYPKPLLDVPLYMLISGRTASAAEAAAYTLQAAKRATIVGETSAGAANPGGELPVGDGFNLFVSTGTPINAVTGTNWEGVGVKPDVRVNPERALERAQILALEAVLARNPNATETIDTRWALEALQAERAPRAGPPLTDYAGTYADATITTVNGSLSLRRRRHPAMTLVRLRNDTFFVKGEPFRRALFERDASGKVAGFQLMRSSGQAQWFRR